MGELSERVDIRMLVDSNGLVENFKNNSLFFYDKYNKSDKDVPSISINNIQIGGFYHFQYLDDSNWMKWSPVFVTNYKKISNQIILFCVNFNFIPLEIRIFLFDKFIKYEDFEKDNLLKVDYEGMYNELIKYGYEYALVEYNLSQVKIVHKISMNLLPRFLISQHPKNKYDPSKLFEIWSVKINDKNKRNQEIMKSMINDFYDINGEISEKYILLKDHIKRLQNSYKKYGNS